MMKSTRLNFRRIFFAALIISLLLPFGLVDAGVIVEDSGGNQLTGIDISGKITTAPIYFPGLGIDALWNEWDAEQRIWKTAGSFGSLSVPRPQPESTTHYIDRLDTTYQRDRVICDTIFIELDSDSTGHNRYKLRRDCDTVYVQQIFPHWSPLKAPLLRPDQIAELMRILTSGNVEVAAGSPDKLR